MTRERKKGSGGKSSARVQPSLPAAGTLSVLITCPVTGKPVNTGIGSVRNEAFAASDFRKMESGPCPYCGQVHSWDKEDAYLEGE
jgi:hypothetical protein